MSSVTKSMIFESADSILESGNTPTVAAVRQLIGKGSFTTINEAMKEWRESRKTPEMPIQDQVPQVLLTRLTSFGVEVWKVASDLANEGLKGEREALDLAKVEMEDQQRETAEMADVLANEVEVLSSKNEDLINLLKAERMTSESTKEALQSEVGEVTKLSAQLESAQLRIAELKENLDLSNKDRDRMNERDRKQASDIARLEEAILSKEEQHKREIEQLEVRLNQAKSERDQAKIDQQKAIETAHLAQVESAKLGGEIDSLKKQVDQQAKMFETLTASIRSKE